MPWTCIPLLPSIAGTRQTSFVRLWLSLLDPQPRRDLGIVAANLLDEPLGVLAADEHLKLDAEREVRR